MSHPSAVSVTVPDFLRAFVDDAATFPPASTPLVQALVEHAAHRSSRYAALVGGFVVSDLHLVDLASIVEQQADRPPVEQRAEGAISRDHSCDPEHLAINLVITGGAGAIEPAVTWLTRSPGLELLALEFALRDEDDLAHNARRLLQVLDSLGEALDDVTVFAEPPMLRGLPTHGWLSALDELASREIHLKFRTGGLGEGLFPSSAALATCIESSLDRELPFKCSGGQPRAVRHDDASGLLHHGFLNVLLATRASLDGEGPQEVARVLDQSDGAAVASRLLADPALATRTRTWFTSFGSCSVLEVHEDLVDLGLIDHPS